MFDLFSVNLMIREPNRVVKSKKSKRQVFGPFFEVRAAAEPINRGSQLFLEMILKNSLVSSA